MDYLVLRWNADRRTYIVMQARFDTYGDAEEYGAERHKEAEQAARTEQARRGHYAPNLYKFQPISVERFKQAIDPRGRRILG